MLADKTRSGHSTSTKGHWLIPVLAALALPATVAGEGAGAQIAVESVTGIVSIRTDDRTGAGGALAVGSSVDIDADLELQPGAAVQLRQGQVVAAVYHQPETSQRTYYVGDLMRAASRVRSWQLDSYLGPWTDSYWQRTLNAAPWAAAAQAAGDLAGALTISAALPPSDEAALLRARLLLKAADFDAALRLLEESPPEDHQARLVLWSFAARGAGDRAGSSAALREAVARDGESDWGLRAATALQVPLY